MADKKFNQLIKEYEGAKNELINSYGEMKKIKFDPIFFESQLELFEILRDKKEDMYFQEKEELKKVLNTKRAGYTHYIISTPNVTNGK